MHLSPLDQVHEKFGLSGLVPQPERLESIDIDFSLSNLKAALDELQVRRALVQSHPWPLLNDWDWTFVQLPTWAVVSLRLKAFVLYSAVKYIEMGNLSVQQPLKMQAVVLFQLIHFQLYSTPKDLLLANELDLQQPVRLWRFV
jgi:hypothetical protein